MPSTIYDLLKSSADYLSLSCIWVKPYVVVQILSAVISSLTNYQIVGALCSELECCPLFALMSTARALRLDYSR